jgi:hypothetical protein
MGAGKIKFEHLRKTKGLARHLEGNQGDKDNLPSSRNQSSRDKELTKRRHGYQNYLFSPSLFQLKDEPEGEGNRAVEEGSFWFEIG